MTEPGPGSVAGTRIGIVGLGNMGSPMAANLSRAGFAVRGYDVADSGRSALADAGGEPVGSAAEAATGADVVVLMLPNSDVVEAVVGNDAFAAALTSGTVLVDMSSSEPLRTRSLAAELAERSVVLVDAPVSGGVSRARAGTLTIMAGGDAGVLDRLAPVLSTLGTVTRAGDVGAGHAIKALNNLLSATHLLATSEAMIAGERFGLDPAVMLAIINSSSGRSGSTENKWPNFVLNERYDSGFGLRLMLKDMRIALALAQQVGTPDALSSDAVALWARAADALPATADHTEVARWVRDQQAVDRPAHHQTRAHPTSQEESA